MASERDEFQKAYEEWRDDRDRLYEREEKGGGRDWLAFRLSDSDAVDLLNTAAGLLFGDGRG